MRRKNSSRACALLLASTMTLSLGACQKEAESSKSDSSAKEGELEKISMYPFDANIGSGVVDGYKGEFFAKNGIELEVWAYSDEKTNAILASGDLPDIMYVDKKNLDTMIEAGMLLNLEDYLDEMPHVQSYEPIESALEFVRKYRSAGTGELYALPLSVGDRAEKVTLTDSTERNAVKLNWEIYEEIGAPKINTVDDLIDVMEQMVKAHPTDENGNPYYGTILNSGSDSQYWMCMTQFFRWQGYDEKELPYLLEANMVDGTLSSILEKDSMYYKGLKWYNEVYRRGLMDPDSINNDRATQAQKVTEGYAMIPSGTLPGWAPTYLEYYIPDTNIYFNYDNKFGDDDKVIAINANTEHLDACLKLLDMWSDPDAYFEILSGPDGEFWVSEGEDAFFTDDYFEFLKGQNGNEAGRTYSTGEDGSLWNTTFVVNTGEENKWTDGEGNHRVGRTTYWKETQELLTDTENFANWKKTTGYNSWKEWLAAEDAYTSQGPLDNIQTFCSLPDESMQLTIDAIKDIVVNASWKMVYAESDEEFESTWEQMVADCEGLGCQDVIDWRLADIEQAKEARDALGN